MQKGAIIAIVIVIIIIVLGGGGAAAWWFLLRDSGNGNGNTGGGNGNGNGNSNGNGNGNTGGGNSNVPAIDPWALHSGFDIPGFDIAGKQVVEFEDACQNKCVENSDCLWYNYAPSDGGCYLKKGNTLAGVTTGIQRSDGSWYVVPDRDIPGFDLGVHVDKTEQECQNICANNTDCQWYNYRASTKDCWPKKGKVNNNVNLGFRIL